MQILAVCRYDFGLNDGQIEGLTLADIEAMETRRNYRFRRQIFNAGIVAAIINNVNRSEGERPKSAFDFLPLMDGEEEEDEEDEVEIDREEVERNVRRFFTRRAR